MSLRHPTLLIAPLLIAATLLPATAEAQQPAVGARVRVAADAFDRSPVVGTLVAITPDSIGISYRQHRFGPTRTVSLARRAATRFDVKVGSHRNVFEGMAIGLLSGVAIGGIVGAVTYDPCASGQGSRCALVGNSRSESAVLTGIVGGVIGLPVGTILGALWVTDNWSPAVVGAAARLRIAPSGNGVGAQLSFLLP